MDDRNLSGEFLVKQTVLAVAFSCINAAFAMAQPSMTDDIQVAQKETRNMLGVLEYCESKGVSEAGALEFLREAASLYDPVLGSSKGDEAEAAGRAGVLSGRGIVKNISDIANEQQRSVEDVCREVVGIYKRGADDFARQKAMSTGNPPGKEPQKP
jgi:hypothetical protein